MSSSVLLCSFYRTKSRIHRAHHPTVSAVTRQLIFTLVALSFALGQINKTCRMTRYPGLAAIQTFN